MFDLSVSIVTYLPSLTILATTLESLTASLKLARQNGLLQKVQIIIVDNGSASVDSGLSALLAPINEHYPFIATELVTGHGNIGFGAGHNVAFAKIKARYYLVLNPDVVIDRKAITHAVSFMNSKHDVGLLCPYASNSRGEQEFLCKRFPSLLDLGLRGFMPGIVQRLFAERLAHYEMRDVCEKKEIVYDVPIISGCFMFVRAEVLLKVHGFSRQFFLYFEDFDFSLRAARIARIAYLPTMQIVHHGGNAAKKGVLHIYLFVRSAIKFFREHGWKFY